MERIVIAGHGSPKKEANNLESVARLLHNMIHPGCTEECVKAAYLQFTKPEIMETLALCVSEGAKKVIIHPYFLSSGMHVTADIPGIIGEARLRYPEVEFIYTEPLGIHNKMVEVVLERIGSATGLRPGDIERKSFEIIADEIDLSGVPEERLPIIKRVIHTTADFEYRASLVFHPDAVRAGIEAIRSGRDILTDVEMVKTGINKKLLEKWGGKVICNIQNAEHRAQNTDGPPFSKGGVGGFVPEMLSTRAEMGIESALKENNNIGIIAVGNAPTALLKTIEILGNTVNGQRSTVNGLVIGVPVGFVKAVESKALLAKQGFPFITNMSRKGGSTVAVAIVNALLKMAEEK